MNIKGKLIYDTEYINCDLTITNGKIYDLNIDDIDSYDLFLSNKDHSSDYEIVKIIDTENSPYNSNYVLKYFGGSKKPSLVYLKLNWLEIIRLKFAMRKMLIQSNEIKIELLKYLTTAILSFIGGVIYQQKQVEHKTVSQKNKSTEKILFQKPKEHKYLKTPNKKDTII
ncbi:hypothetical protein [Flavobacterium yafengii]|uniref:hypothetical protein n=1 Tax=Flavobacterium yafengii TaxID=3041253 RepID=UPI0024A7C670|nr:hypothetical protein [Flavobacterium yafengii]MDI5899202.1 hypothetical protein [Flavobacterium yafengii]